jgi:sugar O-acyltransferase (sialic acid O-acetyltransferase NeuD family)
MNANPTLIIIGAGGHGRVVADCAKATEKYQEIIFLDDCFSQRQENLHWPIVGPVEKWPNYRTQADFIVAFGNNDLRASTLNVLKEAGVNITNVIHPSAVVSSSTQLGKGIVVFANAVVNIGATIADGCIINTAATIDHDCNVGHYCHISPGVHVAGGVKIGALSWLGIGSAVIEYIELAERTQVGAGAVITKPTLANTLYLGVPAKAIHTSTLEKNK